MIHVLCAPSEQLQEQAALAIRRHHSLPQHQERAGGWVGRGAASPTSLSPQKGPHPTTTGASPLNTRLEHPTVLQLPLMLLAPHPGSAHPAVCPFLPRSFLPPCRSGFLGWQVTHGHSSFKVDQISSPPQGMLWLGSSCLRWDGPRWDGRGGFASSTAALRESSP